MYILCFIYSSLQPLSSEYNSIKTNLMLQLHILLSCFLWKICSSSIKAFTVLFSVTHWSFNSPLRLMENNLTCIVLEYICSNIIFVASFSIWMLNVINFYFFVTYSILYRLQYYFFHIKWKREEFSHKRECWEWYKWIQTIILMFKL